MPVEVLSASQKKVTRANDPAHVPALDGVRGLAIAMVLALHFLSANNQTGRPFFDFISAITTSLWIGVDLFFALSGFLITESGERLVFSMIANHFTATSAQVDAVVEKALAYLATNRR